MEKEELNERERAFLESLKSEITKKCRGRAHEMGYAYDFMHQAAYCFAHYDSIASKLEKEGFIIRKRVDDPLAEMAYGSMGVAEVHLTRKGLEAVGVSGDEVGVERMALATAGA